MLELYKRHEWLHSVRSVLTVGALVIAILSAFLLDRPAHADPITSLGYTPRAGSTNTPEPASIFMFATGAFMLLSLKQRIRF